MKIKILGISMLLAVLFTAFSFTKNFTANGRVTNEKGVALPNVTVVVKETQNRTVTDSAGRFSLEVPGTKATLVMSYVGYETTEVKVKNEQEITVKLKPATQALQEVVIVGYGSQQKSALTGAVQKQLSGYAPGLGVTGYDAPRKGKKGAGDAWRYNNDIDREGYGKIEENPFLKATDNPLSTFSIDVDAASYSNVRRMLSYNQLPPAGAVRIEEMINYFTYNYPQPGGQDPFSINTEIAACPWNREHRLVSIGLQGKKMPTEKLPSSNLTFLIDVSGSMQAENKLPLVKASMKLLTEQLREQDRVSIVVYAGNAGLVLPPTPGTDKAAITGALERLEAGGSTAGGAGILLAYKTAKENFVQNGNNRVILCTDGDFNVGASSDDAMERLIEEERKSGVFLTVLGYGMGNYQDAKMQKLADKGNGNHAYIDNLNEAKKVLVNEFGGTLFTIAKDVKLQIEFNPAKVQGYRLFGYENRLLAQEDFNNDKKDAGELGSGHTVTALYEIIPVGVKSKELNSVDALRYQKPKEAVKPLDFAGELMNIKLRYKQPQGDVSKLLEQAVPDKEISVDAASENLRFAAAVAQFGLLLRNSSYKANSSWSHTEQLAAHASGYDPGGYRKEFLKLVQKARKLSKELAVNEE
ncbi:MAG: von Willebrand factor type A domain-containing protein [Williamsia sp.]|nr:von Willebrand factor type A domain-containing protein [Williamsia sp.]